MKRLDEISLKPKDRQAVETLSGLLRARFPVNRIILFGSKARGDDGPDSDIDLLVLTSRRLTDAEKRDMSNVVFDVEIEFDVLVSKLVVPEDAWDRGLYQVLPIRRQVDREGVAA